MKTIRLTILFLHFPLFFFGQTLTGLWTGTISNDSTSVRKDQSFEIVLTQYRDKVYGYSHSEFIVNDTLFYITKRITGTIDGDVCEVKDDYIISYNFRGRLDKGVKMTSTFYFDHSDSTWKLNGNWKTNKTKTYYAVSGKIDLKGEKDLSKSKIFPHLEELKLTDEVAFYKESKKPSEPLAANKEMVSAKKEEATKKDIAKTKTPVENIKTDLPAIKEKQADNKGTDVAVAKTKSEPVKETKQPAIENKNDVPVKEEKVLVEKQQPQKSETVAVVKSAEQKKNAVEEIKNKETIKQEPAVSTSLFKETDKPNTVIAEIKTSAPPAAASVAERKVAPPQIVNFRSDSLELALYDNGEIDGDTVSVLLNGEIILAKQGLKASAIKKTIYVPAGKDDSLTLVLYAENLGKYPPNTGLLIVHDGDETFQIRFSADLQQNAAVIFKRKKY